MAQTGQTLYKYLQQSVDQAYSGYLNTFKADRLFKDALLKTLENKYSSQDNQKSRDELSYIFSTDNILVPNNNQLSTQPLQVIGVTVLNPTTFTITTFLPHNLSTGNSVTISGVNGTLNIATANGTFVVTVTSATTFTITVVSATGVYAANTGKVITPTTIIDYWHLLSMKVKYSQPIYDWTVTAASNTSPIVLTISSYNSFRTGEKLTISGVTGNTNANGTFYVKVVNTKKLALYADVNFQTPIAGNSFYTGGGVIAREYYNYVTPYLSEEKIGFYNEPTVDDPGIDIVNNRLKIYPTSVPCTEVTIDYVKVPQQLIVTTDNIIDLTLYYPEKFLLLIVDEAAQIFAGQVRDPELYQEQTVEIAQNQ
jgi:hypothetical protein